MAVIDNLSPELLKEMNEFALRLEWARRLPPYEIHKWWAKRLAGVVSLLISFSQLKELPEGTPKEIVERLFYDPPKTDWKLLDPFAGSGVIPLEATRHGMESYAVEVDPLAFRILKAYEELSNEKISRLKDALKATYQRIKNVWAIKCPKCGAEALIVFLITSPPPEMIPRYVKVYCENCKYRGIVPVNEEVKRKFIKQKEIDCKEVIPTGKELNRLRRIGFSSIIEIVNPKVLETYEIFLEECQKREVSELGELAISSSIPFTSCLSYYSEKWRKIITTLSIKGLWIPKKDSVIQNPVAFKKGSSCILPLGRSNIASAIRKFEKAFRYMNNFEYHPENLNIYLGDAQNVISKLNVKFDIIFTDPPYFDLIEYEELSYPFRKILEHLGAPLRTPDGEYLIGSKEKEKEYFRRLTQIFRIIGMKSKKETPIILTFHHQNEEVVKQFVFSIEKAGLYLTSVYSVAGESSGGLIRNRITVDGVFIFKKYKPKQVSCQIVKFKKPRGRLTPKDLQFMRLLREIAEEISYKYWHHRVLVSEVKI